ncbi:hypothetical protein R9C00_12115 [Flammeovirgaceae bacterium SG7u.111]|nr:hypothetical protein [Flammeovirgaceae bacterium SG7u.132]WPO38198.1 hypothetical protein R9C00_12115 [Flammeovirgaceae bacterium SG7u.111]
MINSILKSLLYILALFILTNCNYETEKSIDITSKILPNGMIMVIKKTNKETTATGMITKHNYGTSHSFRYNISFDHGDIIWEGGSGEPKNILFCKDTMYIRYLKEKSIKVEYTDSVDNTIKADYHYEIREVYQKHIDGRYFFKLFGDEYWVDIMPENYPHQREFCEEYPIPNDGELSLDSISQ